MSPQRRKESSVTTTMPSHHTHQSSTPRYLDMPQEFEASYLQIPASELQNYALTSSYGPSLMQPYMPGDFDFYNDLNGHGSSLFCSSGATTIADISPPQSDAGSDDPRLQSDDGSNIYSWSVSECSTSDSIFSPELSVGPLFDAFPMQWPIHGPNTPPPEPELENHLVHLEQPTVCENLGVSKLQAYSKPRHSPPRLLRPSNERTSSLDSGEEASSPTKDDKERAKARTDPLYDMKPDKDGFYRCPKQMESGCQHKPTKQKCIFAKYLDTHLKPYLCKHASISPDCEELRFSSNACLFRHEREAHGLHNHGKNPYMCKVTTCDRHKPGNGFPRHWNRRDHMRRVHGLEPEAEPGQRRQGGPKHRQKMGGTPMKRSRSGKSEPYSKDTRPDVTARHAQLYAPMEHIMPMMPDAYMMDSHPVYYTIPNVDWNDYRGH